MHLLLPGRPPPFADFDPFSVLFACLFNHFSRGQSIGAALVSLEGKRVCIRVTDVPLKLNLGVAGGGLKAAPPGVDANVTLRGRLVDFARLATRAEDADTLFFERRLSIEGETETGLAIKNALDALEWDWRAHFAALVPAGPQQLFRTFAQPLRHPPRGPFERHRPPR